VTPEEVRDLSAWLSTRIWPESGSG
jgi:hypothetical protein